MNKHSPYNYPFYPLATDAGQNQQQPYRKQNGRTHFVMGALAGAAVAYMLTNKQFKQGVTATGERAWSAVRGEVEELKERLEDTQAELEYYRNLHKGQE